MTGEAICMARLKGQLNEALRKLEVLVDAFDDLYTNRPPWWEVKGGSNEAVSDARAFIAKLKEES